ncbi:MAG TPA: penicillin-binding transpeptidase domain-containing protein [Candidatus Dormibacteraeota bacterium]|nr:penicillin-binding transpeptidase domain-containing protein [Candidatus Dormibacteraeota bacterium]
MRHARKRRWPAARWLIAAAVAVAVVAGAVVVVTQRGGASLPRTQVTTYLTDWGTGDVAGMGAQLDAAPPDLAKVALSLTRSAPGSRATYTLTGLTAAAATYQARVDVAGFGPVQWTGTLPLLKVHGAWRIRWAESDLFPGLVGAEHLILHRTWSPRAPILGADGSPLMSEQPAVTVGVEPSHVKQLSQVQSVLSSLLGVDPAAVARALAAPGVRPDYFVPIITIPAAQEAQLRSQLAPVPGIVFQRASARLPASPGLAPQVLGAVGAITAQRLSQLGPPYQVGDLVGLAGLESVFERQLAGTPTGTVDVDDATGAVVQTVQRFPGSPPQPVQITLDLHTQQAAQAALSGVSKPAALVAVDASTGAIRAVVSDPADQPFDRALAGMYPPGSTFKVITTTALLEAGRTASTPATCPPSLTVDGKTFTNFEGEAPGGLTLERAFAISCNTAFIGLAQQLPAGALEAAAAAYGFGAHWTLPLASVGGSVPPPADPVAAAASAIGQGQVTASPLQMAIVAATADTGQWHAPQLVAAAPASGATAAPTAAAASATTVSPGAAPAALAPQVLATLHSLMAGVVSSGTGTAAAVPGATIYGKTGTAEFGSGNPPATHAWFIGFRGDLAFAILVEGGGVGGVVAAPLAARFLQALPS